MTLRSTTRRASDGPVVVTRIERRTASFPASTRPSNRDPSRRPPSPRRSPPSLVGLPGCCRSELSAEGRPDVPEKRVHPAGSPTRASRHDSGSSASARAGKPGFTRLLWLTRWRWQLARRWRAGGSRCSMARLTAGLPGGDCPRPGSAEPDTAFRPALNSEVCLLSSISIGVRSPCSSSSLGGKIGRVGKASSSTCSKIWARLACHWSR